MTTTNVVGSGSLGEAIDLANSTPATQDTIQINVTGTIDSQGALPAITTSMDINGPGPRQLTLDAQGNAWIFFTYGSSIVTLSGMTLKNALANSAPCQGAAVMARDGGTVTLRNMNIVNNKVSCTSSISLGGAVYSAGPLTVENSTIAGNTVENTVAQAFGGAIYAPSGATLRSSTITNNTALGPMPYGGGLLVDGTGAGKVSSFRSTTIAGNTSANAANLYVGMSHPISMRNTILANPLGGGADCTNTGVLTDDGFNLVSDATCAQSQPTDLSGNAQLGPLADNGGPTDTMLPALSSPVIDHGLSSGLTADQRGLNRPADITSVADGTSSDGADIGAVEVQPEAPPAGSGDVTLGKVKINKKKGTASVIVTVNGAGQLELTSKTAKTATASATGAGEVTIAIVPKGKSKKKLKKKGKARVAYTVAFSPSSGTPDSATGSAKLKRKIKK